MGKKEEGRISEHRFLTRVQEKEKWKRNAAEAISSVVKCSACASMVDEWWKRDGEESFCSIDIARKRGRVDEF